MHTSFSSLSLEKHLHFIVRAKPNDVRNTSIQKQLQYFNNSNTLQFNLYLMNIFKYFDRRKLQWVFRQQKDKEH